MDAPPEPVFTGRLQLGFGLLAFGLGLMFLSGKVLPAPLAGGIASGIALAVAGFVLVVVEALRDPRGGPDDRPPETGGGGLSLDARA
jgi:hypothetical protein